jgi:hypothetical protein
MTAKLLTTTASLEQVEQQNTHLSAALASINQEYTGIQALCEKMKEDLYTFKIENAQIQDKLESLERHTPVIDAIRNMVEDIYGTTQKKQGCQPFCSGNHEFQPGCGYHASYRMGLDSIQPMKTHICFPPKVHFRGRKMYTAFDERCTVAPPPKFGTHAIDHGGLEGETTYSHGGSTRKRKYGV